MNRRLCDSIPLHIRLKNINKLDKTSIILENNEFSEYEKQESIKFQPILEQWKTQDYFAKENVWNERLSALNCKECEFGMSLVPEPFLNINSIEKNLKELLDEILYLDQNLFAPINPHGTNIHDNKIDFCYSLRRVIEIEIISFRKVIKEKIFTNSLSDIDFLLENYSWSYDRQFKQICTAALVTELHYARDNGLLFGDSPEKRFEDFILRVTADRDWTKYFFEEYPVLLFILVSIIFI